MINFHLSSTSHRFRDIASRVDRKPSHPSLNPRSFAVDWQHDALEHTEHEIGVYRKLINLHVPTET